MQRLSNTGNFNAPGATVLQSPHRKLPLIHWFVPAGAAAFPLFDVQIPEGENLVFLLQSLGAYATSEPATGFPDLAIQVTRDENGDFAILTISENWPFVSVTLETIGQEAIRVVVDNNDEGSFDVEGFTQLLMCESPMYQAQIGPA